MRYTVVLTAAFPDVARRILAPHFDVIEHPTEHGRSEEDVMTLLAEADALCKGRAVLVTEGGYDLGAVTRCLSAIVESSTPS